ncbi:MAG: zf-HC2 domain-containing protein [Rhodoferax sp.]|nr:zf-HC2 domain-containing protein [Rhodoferax sp.]
MIPLNRTCKQVSALLIAREDRLLPWNDRLALRLHMAMCATCPRFERQLLTMGNAMKQWRSYDASASESPDHPKHDTP